MKIPFKKSRIQFYLKIGLAYLLLWMFIDLATHPTVFYKFWINEIWRAVYLTTINYFFLEYSVHVVSRKRILRSIALIVLQIFLYSYGLYSWRNLGIELGIHTPFKSFKDVSHAVSEQMSASVFSLVFFGVIRHLSDYRNLKLAAQQLRIEKQEAELSYLKSQTNPHFLFNTLNNIYALSREKSDRAPESILRLSKILRYMLYEAGGEYIAIEQEIKIISDYIELEKLRYDESLRINFNHNIEDMRQALPPLLLIPLVENAFKHGVSETRNQPFVDIHISVNNRQLKYTVRNSTEQAAETDSVKENIGLSNLRRQLELLYTDYKLSVQQSETVFTASLTINLASHV